MNPYAEQDGYEAIVMEAIMQAEPLFMIRIATNALTIGLKNASMYVDSLKTFFFSKQTAETIN